MSKRKQTGWSRSSFVGEMGAPELFDQEKRKVNQEKKDSEKKDEVGENLFDKDLGDPNVPTIEVL